MGSPGVVVDAPFLDDRLGFLKAVEDLAIEHSSRSLPLNDSAVSILPMKRIKKELLEKDKRPM